MQRLRIFEDTGSVMDIVVWERLALEGADFMEEQGAIISAKNLRVAVDILLVMSAEVVEGDKLSEAMFVVIKERGETSH